MVETKIFIYNNSSVMVSRICFKTTFGFFPSYPLNERPQAQQTFSFKKEDPKLTREQLVADWSRAKGFLNANFQWRNHFPTTSLNWTPVRPINLPNVQTEIGIQKVYLKNHNGRKVFDPCSFIICQEIVIFKKKAVIIKDTSNQIIIFSFHNTLSANNSSTKSLWQRLYNIV